MKTYPINLDITGRNCAVIGGGEVAFRKICSLLEAGAIVKVIAPEICAGVEELFQRGKISLTRENFSPDMLDNELLLIAATDNPAINQQAAEVAQAKKILVNVVSGADGNFFVPSRIQRGDLLLTISTGQNSPAFSKFVRLMLERELGENFGAGLELIAKRRQEVKQLLPNSHVRQKFWQEILTPKVWNLLRKGQLNRLEELIDNALKSFGTQSQDSTD